jgi:peroxiredoxin
MKLFSSIFSLLLLSSIPLHAQKALPDITLKTLEGKPVRLLEYAAQHQVTVLSFWATWCAPCKRELDAMTELHPAWTTKYDVQILAITVDDQRQLPKAKPMANAQGWPFTLLSDAAGQLKNALNFQAIPHTVVVNQKGEILYEHTGYVPGDELELEKKIARFGTK